MEDGETCSRTERSLPPSMSAPPAAAAMALAILGEDSHGCHDTRTSRITRRMKGCKVEYNEAVLPAQYPTSISALSWRAALPGWLAGARRRNSGAKDARCTKNTSREGAAVKEQRCAWASASYSVPTVQHAGVCEASPEKWLTCSTSPGKDAHWSLVSAPHPRRHIGADGMRNRSDAKIAGGHGVQAPEATRDAARRGKHASITASGSKQAPIASSGAHFTPSGF